MIFDVITGLFLSKLTILLIDAVAIYLAFIVYRDNKKGDSMNATISINGVVIDKLTGEALTGVKVELSGTSEATYTDFDGNFTIEGLAPGNYSLATFLISYEEKSKEIDLNSSNVVQIELEKVNK